MDRSWTTEEGGSSRRPGHVDGSTAWRGTERTAAGWRRSSEVRGGCVAAPRWSVRRARPTGVGSALVPGAGAQTAYVSNLNQTSEPTSATMLTQSFTTGSQPGGYALGSVELSVRNLAGRTVAATIYETDGFGRPTTTVKHALTPPSTFPSDSTLTFTAPAGAILDADTTYSVVFSGSVNVGFERTESNSEDAVDTGWSIRDEYARRLTNGAWAHHSSKSLLIAFKGPIPSSDADAVAAGFQVDLAPGANVVKVVVTAEDGSTTETYAVTVARGTTVDLEVPADWSLKPDAVGAGGRFWLLFVSSTVRTPDSAESPTTTAGHADIQPFADQFREVGSTADVNVRLTH